MMDLQQQNVRRAAARAFIESLDKLQETLCDAEPAITSEPEVAEAAIVHPSKASVEINLNTLEQAVADIEQFMQAKQS